MRAPARLHLSIVYYHIALTSGSLSTAMLRTRTFEYSTRVAAVHVNESETFLTYCDNQPGIFIQIYGEERVRAKDNLDKPNSPAIPSAPRGVLPIRVHP